MGHFKLRCKTVAVSILTHKRLTKRPSLILWLKDKFCGVECSKVSKVLILTKTKTYNTMQFEVIFLKILNLRKIFHLLSFQKRTGSIKNGVNLLLRLHKLSI